MDDMNPLHKIPQEVSVIIEDLKAKYQDYIGKMKFSRGKKLRLFGYDLGLKNARRVQD